MTTRYANPNSVGGDGTTPNLTGATAAYKTISDALAPFHGTTLSAPLIISCSGAGGTAADTTGLDHTPLEIVTTPTNYLEIQGDNTTGVWNENAYRIELTNTNAMYNQYVAHGRMRNMQIMVKVTDGGNYLCYRWSTANNDTSGGNPYFLFDSCIARKDPRSTSGTVEGWVNSICGDGSKNGPLYITNCLAIGCDSSGGSFNTDAGTWVNNNVYHWNCTAVRGLYGFVDCANVKNCIGAYNFGSDFITTAGHDYNASSDGTAAGTHSRTSQTFSFRNPGNDDYHLLTTDGGAKGFGVTDPSGTGVYSTDIDGQARSGSWDIGCDQQGSASAALTGTVTASITESDIVTGGKTVICTLTNDAFPADMVAPNFIIGATKGTIAADSDGGGSTGNSTLTCTFPTGYTPLKGDLAVMILYLDQGSATTPTNWSVVSGAPFGAGTEKLYIFYKKLAGGESSPQTTISGSAVNLANCAQIAIYKGGNIGTVGTGSNGTGTPMTATAITTTQNNAWVLFCCGRGDNENASGQTFNASATGVTERLDGGSAAGNDAQVSMADKFFATSGTSSGAGSSTTSATDPWVGVMVEIIPSTDFTDARSAIATGLDSAQSEGGGWDAKVKVNIPVANVVRTSPTVCTITLQAQADYDITATETITWTLPASGTNVGGAPVASPTFTVDASGGVTPSATDAITIGEAATPNLRSFINVTE